MRERRQNGFDHDQTGSFDSLGSSFIQVRYDGLTTPPCIGGQSTSSPLSSDTPTVCTLMPSSFAPDHYPTLFRVQTTRHRIKRWWRWHVSRRGSRRPLAFSSLSMRKQLYHNKRVFVASCNSLDATKHRTDKERGINSSALQSLSLEVFKEHVGVSDVIP